MRLDVEKIFITPRSFRKIDGPHRQVLIDAGYEIVESPAEGPLEAAELARLVPDVVGVILGLDEFTAEVFDRAGRLKVVSRFGVGVDKVDLKAATAHGVVVTNTPGANTVAVAELTIALILALARRLPYHDRLVREGRWTPVSGFELCGSGLGLIGMGNIGRGVAKRAVGFGARILYHDPVAPPQELLTSLEARYCELDDLLSESDIISLHLPLTDETRNLIDGRALGRMKPTALLINTSRGGLVDEQALVEALMQGRLAGAACDAFAQEPPSDNPLLRLDNFIATPHIGSATRQTSLRMGLMAAENALAVLRSERPTHVVNPEVYSLL